MNEKIALKRIQTVGDLGQLVREYRKQKHLTLEKVSGLGNVSMRFLSEFERGKETAEIGKILKTLKVLGLDVIIRPRSAATLTDRHNQNSRPGKWIKL